MQNELKQLCAEELEKSSLEFSSKPDGEPLDMKWRILTANGEQFRIVTPLDEDDDMWELFGRMAQEFMKRDVFCYSLTFEAEMAKQDSPEAREPILTSIAAVMGGEAVQCFRTTFGGKLGPIEWMDKVDAPVKPLGIHIPSKTQH